MYATGHLSVLMSLLLLGVACSKTSVQVDGKLGFEEKDVKLLFKEDLSTDKETIIDVLDLVENDVVDGASDAKEGSFEFSDFIQIEGQHLESWFDILPQPEAKETNDTAADNEGIDSFEVIDAVIDTTDAVPDTVSDTSVCIPDCSNKECGDDGCGGSCGVCGAGFACQGGKCVAVCMSECGQAGQKSCINNSVVECKDKNGDGCLEWVEVEECEDGWICQQGSCVCQPDCTNKECGDDGCGGSCGVCSGWEFCNQNGKCEAETWQHLGVGVDYHATGSDFQATAFLNRYNNSQVRQKVIEQLQGMANSGLDLIFTRIWLVTIDSENPYGFQFPPTEQQLSNLRQYVEDVASIQKPDGTPLRLYLCLLYLWCADYKQGSPDTTLGQCNLTEQQFAERTNATIESIVDAVEGIYDVDGRPAVQVIYLDGEVMTAGSDADPATAWEKKNQRWFIQTFWPNFAQRVREAGMIPSLYFILESDAEKALDFDFQDPYFAELNGRRSVFWLYRTLYFMQQAGLELPARIDFSFYPGGAITPFSRATIVRNVLADVDFVIQKFGISRYGVAETYYFKNANARYELGKAFALHYIHTSNPAFVAFWTTPYNSGFPQPVAYPFDVDAFTASQIVELEFPNGSFEDATGEGIDGWSFQWTNGNVQGWKIYSYYNPPDVLAGDRCMRVETGSCQSCTGPWDGVWVESENIAAPQGKFAAVAVWQRNSIFPGSEPPASGSYWGVVVSLIGLTLDGTEVVIGESGAPYGGWKFYPVVVGGYVDDSIESVRLRLGVIKSWNKVVDFDAVGQY